MNPYLNQYIKVPRHIAAWAEAKYGGESGGVRHCLGLVVTNLLAYGPVAYARHRPNYTTMYSTTTAMLQAVGHLITAGYATSSKGFKISGHVGVPSTLTPTPKLVGALPPVSRVEVDIATLPVLTVDDKHIYKGWQLPAALPLTAYSTMVKLNREYFNLMVLDLRQLAPGTKCLTEVNLTRMYTAEPTGGAYGVGRLCQMGEDSYQQLPEEQRTELLLNGEEVIELDYSAMHPHLLYCWAGQQCPEGFYESIMAGCGCTRFIAKQVALIALNTASPQGLAGAINSDKRNELKANLTRPVPKPILYDELKAQNITAMQVVTAIKQAHPAIAKYLFTRPANRLMLVESDILVAVLLRLMELGIPALPIHDSLVIPVRCGVEVRQVMEDEYHRQTGYNIIVA